MVILGISALYHDSAACVVRDGVVLAAMQEERFTRIKHDPSFPVNAIRHCLCVLASACGSAQIDAVAYYDDPMLTLERFLKNVLAAGENSQDLIQMSFNGIFAGKLWVREYLERLLGEDAKRAFYVCKHHISHAASAFYPSPFREAVVLTLDGVGEWATTAIGVGRDTQLELKEQLRYPHSLGLLYSAFTYFCGFKVNSGDYKFMGLAPYGQPTYEELIREELIDIRKDGSFRLNLDYFDFPYGRAMTNERFSRLFGGPRREPESRITRREMDIAASAQKVTEDIILRLARHAKEAYGTGIENLVMAGGVALNCVANGKLRDAGIFRDIWIQPAAGDAGGSLGAALYASYRLDPTLSRSAPSDTQRGSFLGTSYSSDEIGAFLNENGYTAHRLPQNTLYPTIARELADGKVLGLFQGRMEFGPRALGGRSILADARSDETQVRLNQKIKFRESFRPFAPAVLREYVSDYFELDGDSPYMLLVEKVRPERRCPFDVTGELTRHGYDMLPVVRHRRSDIPAVTHVDYSARIQTVDRERNPYFHALISAFHALTGCAVLVNTSFNVRGEPIVESPRQAYDCFMRTGMDVLVLEDYILYKEEQPAWQETEDWRNLFALD